MFPISNTNEYPELLPPVHVETLTPLSAQASSNAMLFNEVPAWAIFLTMLGIIVISSLLYYRRGYLLSNRRPDLDYIKAIEKDPALQTRLLSKE
jgi:hypothetical protein